MMADSRRQGSLSRSAATEIAEEQIAYWRARDYTVQRAWAALGVQRTAWQSYQGWQRVDRFMVRWLLAHAEDERGRRAA